MVYLTRKIEFSASHLYHNPAFSPEENRRIFGKCNHPGGHGHNYVLEVTVGGEADPQTGMVLDLLELKQILETEIMRRMDHRFLNYEVAELAGQIPTCENIAAAIWQLLEPKIRQGRLHRVRLWESPELYVDCYGDGAAGLTADEGAKESADPPAQKAGRGMTGSLTDQRSWETAAARANAKADSSPTSATSPRSSAGADERGAAGFGMTAGLGGAGEARHSGGEAHTYDGGKGSAAAQESGAAGLGMTTGREERKSRERAGEIAAGQGQRQKPPDSRAADVVAEATTHKAQDGGAGTAAGSAKPNGARVSLTRRYSFAASHRLHSAQLDDEANQRIYGKCNNPYGHGHNYVVEVTVSGAPDPATGMIAHLGELDCFVEREVLDPFDHKYLNEDVPAFRELVPTTENLCMEIFKRLAGFPGARLERIRVEETGKNSFEYWG